jgi:hypothetical protein
MKTRSGLQSFLIPSIADFFFALLLLFLSLVQGQKLLHDGDTGYHVAIGDYILDNLSIPKADLFRHISPPIPWTPHEWLSEVVMALIHRMGGLTGVVVFSAILIALTYYLLFRMLRSSSYHILLVVLVTVLVITCSDIHWLARPHLFTLLLTVCWYYLLERLQQGSPRAWYLLPLLMVLWVNLHGGYVIGFILLGIYLCANLYSLNATAGEDRAVIAARLRFLSTALLLSLLAAICNPSGYRVLLVPVMLLRDSYMTNNVLEYLSPNFHETLIFKYVLLGMLLVFALSRQRATPIETLLVIFFTNMALYSARHIPLFAIIVAPIIVRHAAPLLEELPACLVSFISRREQNLVAVDSSARGFVWPALSVVMVIALAARGTISWSFDASKKPLAAIEFLQREHVNGNMFNNDEFGDFLIYRASSEYKVFYDGRMDMDGPCRLKEYAKVVNLQSGWEKVFDDYGITWVFFDADSLLSRTLLASREWQLLYSDKVASILVKKIPQYQYLLEKYPDVKPSGK